MRPSLSSFEWVKSRFISTTVQEKYSSFIFFNFYLQKTPHFSKEVALWTLLKSYSVIIMVLTYKYVTRSFQLRTLCNLGRVICNKLLCVLLRKCYSERRFRYSASFCKTYRVSKMKNSCKKGYIFLNFLLRLNFYQKHCMK